MKWTWLLAAVALAGWLIARRHKQERWFQVAELVAIAAAALIGLGVIHLPNFEKLLRGRRQALGQWTYLVVGVLAFLETGAFVGFVAPGETAVIVGGLVAGQGQISLFVLIAIVWACAVLGDVTSYELGRRLGRGWLLRHGERLKITEERLDQVEGFFERRGGVTILVGRFLGFVRPLAPFIAGAVADAAARASCPTTCSPPARGRPRSATLGYVFWRSIDKLTTYVSRGLFAFGTLVVVIGGDRRARPPAPQPGGAREGARRGSTSASDRPGWRLRRAGRPPALARSSDARPPRSPTAPPASSRDRLTPGNLGLELTTLLALLAVGAFSFFCSATPFERRRAAASTAGRRRRRRG